MSMADYYHAIAALAFFIFSALVTTAEAQPMPWQLCNTNSGNYTVNSKYKANIEYLATSLPQYAASSPSLFASGSSGTSPDVIYALALCRGDTNASSCATCVAAAIQSAEQLCPLNKGVTMYDNPCILRFSDKGFPISHPYNKGMYIAWSFDNVTAAESPAFEAATAKLVNATVEYAAADPIRRFGTGVEAFDQSYPKIYSLAQCTPDMTADECRSCLRDIIGRFTATYFAGKHGGRVVGVRCNFRYETYPFFYGSPLLQLPGPLGPAPAPASTATGGEGTRVQKRTVLAIAVPTVSVAVVLTAIVAWFSLWRTRLAAKALQPIRTVSTGPDDEIQSIGSLLLDLSTLRLATDDFSEHKRLGEGGFGVVYKGDLPQGQEIAVKRLAQTSRQGIEELKTELLLVAKLNHKNLVRLVGVCLEENEKILAYEYMPNRSLDTILFAKAKELGWEQRFNIILGIARGLQYLHEDSQLKIVHRDLKASNVLLDSAYNPKISDFGLAKIFGRDQSQVVTHRIAGTYGYMSPEYAMRGQYSIKSDVYSFGVLVLEIVTGRRNFGSNDSEKDGDLINLTWEHWIRDKTIDLIDPSLSNPCPIDKVLKCIHIGLLCVQQKPTDRPLMSAVNFMLSSSTVCLPSLSRPSIWFQETGASSNDNSELNPTASITFGTAKKVSQNDVSITVLEPR
ncbi:cysteine-rich receptor-like protein kinase 10 isoform X2 [Panicum virgatum]|uniref:Cysteine-rich receptor-like protein kinase 10 n=1 Tax=Panicum virgatum TaxID=38727 RepID=A0A8T0XGB2_PANVG|nr:cysteine-rich receptor-like protein kinase 10 isoform X2 [Panicum virgatum]KAG2657898.1 hypothetical protein PVAP13_1KG142800 [Panicum virgatum]